MDPLVNACVNIYISHRVHRKLNRLCRFDTDVQSDVELGQRSERPPAKDGNSREDRRVDNYNERGNAEAIRYSERSRKSSQDHYRDRYYNLGPPSEACEEDRYGPPVEATHTI